jgi:FAD-dependent urate hydroxylase
MRSRREAPVAIVGAGPYGLAAAAHLVRRGVLVHAFGRPMSTWSEHMPRGMNLRSPRRASSIADPEAKYTLDQFGRTHAVDWQAISPIRVDHFVRYGSWFQANVLPDLDERHVVRIEPEAGGFKLLLDDGDHVHAARVVVAAGLLPFEWLPSPLQEMPLSLVSHSSHHCDLARFAGRRVLIVGAGQSALEFAALLIEAGAETEVLVRRPAIHWRRRWFRTHGRLVARFSRLTYGPSEVGPAGMSWASEWPRLYRGLGPALQRAVLTASIIPEPDLQLRERVGDTRITTGRTVLSAAASEAGLGVRLSDGSRRTVDHAICATGFRVDVGRYSFLSRDLLTRVRTVDGFPELGPGLESSYPGLHFLGAPAMRSFGPLMAFVAGARYASKALARRVAG